jgi:hypothetical protein
MPDVQLLTECAAVSFFSVYLITTDAETGEGGEDDGSAPQVNTTAAAVAAAAGAGAVRAAIAAAAAAEEKGRREMSRLREANVNLEKALAELAKVPSDQSEAGPGKRVLLYYAGFLVLNMRC